LTFVLRIFIRASISKKDLVHAALNDGKLKNDVLEMDACSFVCCINRFDCGEYHLVFVFLGGDLMRIISQNGMDFPYEHVVVILDGCAVICRPVSDMSGRYYTLGTYKTENRAK